MLGKKKTRHLTDLGQGKRTQNIYSGNVIYFDVYYALNQFSFTQTHDSFAISEDLLYTLTIGIMWLCASIFYI